ncbi:MAG: tripartite tricarboxylate transporter permease [Candidatus Aenigmarchaeota archaeon]|nr:tripartite tricarboxylate transporter permease [Candidatus Aenigmarchaeota archaeon]
MFLEILLFVFLGIAFGIVTGLIPGLHPNTIFTLIFSLAFLFTGLPVQLILAFVVSLAVSNTFFDFIPTILFGAPEEDSVLSVLPGHKLLLKGRGYEAIFLVTMGGLGVMLLTVFSLPALFFFLPLIYTTIKPVIHIILLSVVAWMVYTERKPLHALSVFILAGIFGLLTLNSFPSEEVMFPALTGLFGMSTVLVSVMTRVKIPPQKIQKEVQGDWLKGSVTGWLAGLLAGLLPGIGSSQAGIIASQFLRAKLREFLIALGGINTSNIFFTFIVFYVIGKTRSGAVWMISQIIDYFTLADVYLLIVVGILTSLISGLLTIKASKFLLNRMRNINYTRMMSFIFLGLITLVFVFSGLIGLLVSITGMFLGLLAISIGIKRTHLMGFLLLPTIAYFSGLNPLFFGILW